MKEKHTIFYCLFLDDGKHVAFDEYHPHTSDDDVVSDFNNWLIKKKKMVSRNAILISLRLIK